MDLSSFLCKAFALLGHRKLLGFIIHGVLIFRAFQTEFEKPETPLFMKSPELRHQYEIRRVILYAFLGALKRPTLRPKWLCKMCPSALPKVKFLDF